MPASHAKGCEFESILRFGVDEKSLEEFVANYIKYIQFRMLGLVLMDNSNKLWFKRSNQYKYPGTGVNTFVDILMRSNDKQSLKI